MSVSAERMRRILAGLATLPLMAAPMGTPVDGTAFLRFSTGRGEVTFYLSQQQSARPLPLLLFVQGTGCGSPFVKEGERILGGLQTLLQEAAAGTARVMVVEKPGVQYLDNPAQPANARNCRPAFLERYSLDNWASTLAKALTAAHAISGVDRSRTLAIGHSEGAITALRLSNIAANITHVAALSGGGPTYLFHMSEYFRMKGLDPEKEVYPCWSQVMKDPTSTNRFCWGQSFRQWASFMRTSMVHEALHSKSALYFGHGSKDDQNPVSAFDVLRAELAAKGRTAIFDRVEGGDHGFNLPGQSPPEGFKAVFRKLLNWFLDSPGPVPR